MNHYLKTIHRGDIYQNLEILPFQTEANNLDKYLDNVLGRYNKIGRYNKNDVTIIEVGSWKGSSAIAMAKYFLNKSITPTIFCVDTWGGATFHREHEEYFNMLKCKNGFPTLYQQFLSNIIHSNLQEYIIPVPHTSHDAARYLKKLGILADFCYVDACHEYDEVLDDIRSYWDLVKSDGVIFGDDFDSGWPGVVGAVKDFTIENKLEDKFELHHSEWLIRK